MRYLTYIDFPIEPFNSSLRDGSASHKLTRIIEETKPEAIYFSEHDGKRGAVAIYQMENPADMPRLAEPWFLTFNAEFRARVAMTPADLTKAGLETLAKQWK